MRNPRPPTATGESFTHLRDRDTYSLRRANSPATSLAYTPTTSTWRGGFKKAYKRPWATSTQAMYRLSRRTFGNRETRYPSWTEYVESRDDYITLTWYDLGEPVMMANPPGEKDGQPHGVYSLLIPAARAPDDRERRHRVRQGASSSSRRHDRHQHVLHRPVGDVDHPARP